MSAAGVIEHRVTGSGGVQLAAYERPARRESPVSDDDAPTVVLVHGYPDTAAVWNPVADRLAEHYRVISYDVRGSGASTIPAKTSSYRLEHLTADLAAVIDALAPGRPVHLVGHDWGSMQSWEAVCVEPARFASFTSISGPCLDHAGRWIRARVLPNRHPARSARELVRQGMRSWYVSAFQLPWLAPMTWKLWLARSWPRLLELGEGARPGDGWPSATLARDAAVGVKLYRANVRDRVPTPKLRTTTVPVQLVVPTGDRFVTPALLDDTPRWAPALWRRDVAAGHWVVRSRPERTARWITDHIEAVEAGPAMTTMRRLRVRALGHSRDRAKARLDGVVVVTGAGSGIGRATAVAFAERGATVAAADINGDAAARTVELCTVLGAEAHAYAVDVADADAMESFAKTIEAELGVPDIVVNNAGIGMAGAMLDTTVGDWERVLGVNLWGVIHGSRLFGAMMADRGEGGHIVNVASAAAFTPSRAYPAYATSKAGVLMLTESLRAELAADGIGVSAICPGLVDTGITTSTRFVGLDEDEQRKRQAATKRLYRRRNFTPDRVAEAIITAVEHNDALRPVTPEARFSHLASRVAPGLVRKAAAVDVTPR